MREQTLPVTSDFQEGFQDGIQAFKEGFFFPEHDKIWTEQDMIELVRDELVGRKYQITKRIDHLMGSPCLPFLHHLGFIAGYLNQAVTTNQR